MSPADHPTGSFDHPGHGLPVEQARLLEAACDRLEAAWRTNGRPDIGAAARELPEPMRPSAVRELVALDIYYRRKAGESPVAGDYDRFPGLDPAWLADAVGADPDGSFGDYDLLEEVAR